MNLHQKWYVVCGKLKSWEYTKDGPLGAICLALSRAKFLDATEIPADYLDEVFFYVDARGFRTHKDDLIRNPDNAFDDGSAAWKILISVGLDRFDHAMRSFDPFCQDEYYRELGEDDE